MKLNLIATALLSAVVATSTAQAASIDFGNYTVSYDETFWGISLGTSATQGVNSLTFSNLGYEADAAGSRKGWQYAAFDDFGFPALTVTADTNYQLSGIGLTAAGNYSLTGVATVQATNRMDVYNNIGVQIGSASTGVTRSLNGAAGYTDTNGVTFANGLQFASLDFNTWGQAGASGTGSGATISHDSSAFTFTVTPIPEPETYAMFLAGLGLMGFMSRRRIK